MYRALPVFRRVASTSGRGVIRVTRRRLATESTPSSLSKKKKSIVRRIFWATAAATGTFYVGSTFAAFYNQTYFDFFSDHVPLGQSMLEYAQAHNWDTLTVNDVIESGKYSVVSTKQYVTDIINRSPTPREAVENAKNVVEAKAHDAKVKATKVISDTKSRVESVKTEAAKETKDMSHKAETITKFQAQRVADELQVLVKKAEAALAGEPVPEGPIKGAPEPTIQPSATSVQPAEGATTQKSKNVYDAPLPVGFEPPPGFSRPSAPKPEKAEHSQSESSSHGSLPLVAPSVSSLSASEPIISHLAGTIDDLASYLASNPAAASKATGVLESAKEDLTALAQRIEKVKEEERAELEAKLDEQTREYTIKLMELEMEAQDKLDSQEEGFRKFFDEERMKFVQAYREKLDYELKTQTELINERLKEEVIAQGIELQRRWIREIKVRVEQERGGRLAKIDELSAHLKRLERVALDNSDYLDENIRIHAMWSALRALNSSALSSAVRKPFREELRVLRHIAAAREDSVVSATLESLESSTVPDIGVEPLADLASWFTREVAPKVSHVALVPDEDAGLLSYVASRVFSGFRFRRVGLVEGDDVLSVVARAEHFLGEKDLDSAARELNQLKGAAKVLLHDWLEAARRRLEVQQALDVVQTQATLASLLVV